ncbi:hypothetical protein D3C84_1079640 [compost metagenome]
MEKREKSATCAQVQEKPKARSMKNATLWVGAGTLKSMICLSSHCDSTTWVTQAPSTSSRIPATRSR